MRTTVDLPDDLYKQALSLARDTSRSLSETVADLMRRGLGHGQAARSALAPRSPQTGLPVMSVGKVVTTEDVGSLEDDEL